eukprot:EG_transcript_48599
MHHPFSCQIKNILCPADKHHQIFKDNWGQRDSCRCMSAAAGKKQRASLPYHAKPCGTLSALPTPSEKQKMAKRHNAAYLSILGILSSNNVSLKTCLANLGQELCAETFTFDI